jgi:malonate-semialdehyde dehydrogenase (acetylating) / methylmalonate-semialdehyde dehydrogenase
MQAVAFVGSNTAGEHIYRRACASGKRVQANMGAKNHAIIMPDADVDATCEAVIGAAFGAAGQRCMVRLHQLQGLADVMLCTCPMRAA